MVSGLGSQVSGLRSRVSVSVSGLCTSICGRGLEFDLGSSALAFDSSFRAESCLNPVLKPEVV